MDGAVDALRAVLCGEKWASAERQLKAGPRSDHGLEALAASVDKRGGFGGVVCRGPTREGPVSEASAWFVDAAARERVCRDRDLSEFALCLASDPLAVVDHANLEVLLGRLADNPAILRAARLLTLLRTTASGGGNLLPPAGIRHD